MNQNDPFALLLSLAKTSSATAHQERIHLLLLWNALAIQLGKLKQCIMGKVLLQE
jgi:hypothetical protein